jgi:hypothetical protein
MMANWTFLTSHAWAMLCIAHDPEVRLRDIAASRGITERRAYGTVIDLAKAGYVVRPKNGRRGRYQTRAHLPLPDPGTPAAAGTQQSRAHRRRRPGPFLLAPPRDRNGGLLGLMDDLGRFPQLYGEWPGQTT